MASPVLSNTGTDRGLPISCFGIDVADSIHDIGKKNLEMMLLAKHGGGVGIGINQIRPAGAKITGNGTSDGVVPFCKIYDSTILATNQGSVRRGAASVNINIEHDFTFYDTKAVDNMAWFDHLTGGHTHTDFFAIRPTDYSKPNEGEDFENIW